MGSIKYCKMCGSKLDEDSLFCTECGQKVEKESIKQEIKEAEQSSVIFSQEPNEGGQIYPESGNTLPNTPGGIQNTDSYIPPSYPPPADSRQYTSYSSTQYSYGAAPKKKSNTLLIVIGILVGIIVLGALAFLGLGVIDGKSKQTSNVPDTKTEIKKETTTEIKTEVKTEAKKIDISNPMSYLPKLYVKYTYEKTDDSGKTDKVNVVSGRATDFLLLSLVEFPEGAHTNVENRFAYRAKHIRKEKDTIDTFSDEDFFYFGKEYNCGKLTRWLPGKVEAGAEWKDELSAHKVTEVGVDCDLGFEKLEDCVVIESKNDSGTVISYVAPDYGMVMLENKDSGKVLYKLTGAEPMNKDEANKIVEHFSIAMSTFIEKYYNK